MKDYVYHLLFVWYPYICLTVFFLGSLIRFDREQYTWRASSSQILRKRQLTWGSNLFHAGILFLLLGHTVGLLTPTWLYTLFITVEQKQLIAVAAGGIAGVVCFVGLTMLLHRRLFDDRIRATSSAMDIAIMSRKLISYPSIRKYTTIWMDSLRDGKNQLVNTNKLIRFYQGATGLKTGFTNRAMYCLSATAERGGVEYIAVVLHGQTSQERFESAKTV